MSTKTSKKLSPQARLLLDYLKDKKTITAVEARAVFHIEALPRRIADLKEAGWDITSKIKKDAQGKRYARYTFNGKRKDAVDSKGTPKVLEKVAPKLELKVGARVKTREGCSAGIFFKAGEKGRVLNIASDGTTFVRFDTVRHGDTDWWVTTSKLEVVSND